MVAAPLASTIVALALIPVAFLFSHAYLSGRRGWKHHILSGTMAVAWDLSLSIFYMLYRTFGGQTDGSILTITPSMTTYFAVHGVIAIIVMVLEVLMLATGYLMWRKKKPSQWHANLTKPMIDPLVPGLSVGGGGLHCLLRPLTGQVPLRSPGAPLISSGATPNLIS